MSKLSVGDCCVTLTEARDMIARMVIEMAQLRRRVDPLEEFLAKFRDMWKRAGPRGSHQFEKFDVVVQMAEQLAEAAPVIYPRTEPGHHADEVSKLRARIKRLEAVMEAADAFLATPSESVKDNQSFHQCTTAADCRALNKAYREACEAEEVERTPRHRNARGKVHGMNLPAGKKCGDCLHIARCSDIYGHNAEDEQCGWSPSKFHQNW